MKRLFLAIKINPGETFFNQFLEIKHSLVQERIKWVEEHNIHVTLKFLGETEEAVIPEVIRVVEDIAINTMVFSFSLRKLGIFGSSYDPRVIWVGIEPYEKLASLMKSIRDNMKVIGYEPDRQNLIPHLTLGRINFLRDKKLFQQILDKNKNISSQEIVVDKFILFESILKKEGPVYQALHNFSLERK